MVSKLLKGRGLGLQVSFKAFPMVYSWICRYVDCGKMTYNYYMLKAIMVAGNISRTHMVGYFAISLICDSVSFAVYTVGK